MYLVFYSLKSQNNFLKILLTYQIVESDYLGNFD